MKVALRPPTKDDIPVLFEQQNDPGAHEMVGITAHAPDDRKAYFKKWKKILPDNDITKRTILFEGRIAGFINCFFAPWSERQEVGYWIGREFWGKGIASDALRQFLEIEKRRPLFATVADHNKGSIRVLEKCGFEKTGSRTVDVENTGQQIKESAFELE